MFDIRIRLIRDKGVVRPFQLSSGNILDIVTLAFTECRRRLDGMDLEFLHLWGWSYAIWGNDKPQGCLIITDLSATETKPVVQAV